MSQQQRILAMNTVGIKRGGQALRTLLWVLLFSMPLFAVNNAPVFTSTAVTTATEDSAYSYAMTASDADNGATLTFSVKTGTTLPAWLSLGTGSTSPTEIATGLGQLGGMAIDTNGNLYVAVLSGTTIYKITPAGVRSDWAVVNASNKYGMLVEGDYLYISYWSLGKITRILLSNPGAGESDWKTGLGNNGPLSMTVRNGELYVATYGQGQIKKINMTTLAVSNHVATASAFGLTFNSSGTLFIANYNDNYISKYEGTTLTTNIKAIGASPSDIKLDANNNLYVSTGSGGGLKKISSDLATTTAIGATTDTIWGLSLDANGALAWGTAGGKVYKLSTGAVLSGTPTNDHVGVHNITLSVSDGTATVDQTFTITVTNTNDAPTMTSGGNLAYTENATSVVNAAIVVADVDAGAVALSANVIISGNYNSSQDTLAYATANGITGSWNSTTGILSLSGNASTSTYQTALRTITYNNSSDNMTSGNRVLGWSVYDGYVASTNIYSTITVTAVNDAPVFTSTAVTTGAAGTAYSYTAVASDADGQTLTYSLTTHPTGMTINASTGVISWTPTVGTNNPSENVVISVTDATVAATQSFTITSTGFNQAPVITQGANLLYTILEDNTLSLSSANITATDADRNALTWSVSANASHGNVTTLTQSSNAITSVVYTPSGNYTGSDNYTLQVSDGSVTATIRVDVTVSPVNDAPVITQGASSTVTMSEDSSPTAFSLTLNATDVESDTLTWSISTAAGHGTASASGTGASKAITYTPTANYNGIDSFVVQVSDGNGGTATNTVTVTISAVNDVPVITQGATSAVTMSEDSSPTAFSLTLSATDVDTSDTLTWSISTAANHGTASASGTGASKAITYTPTANYNGTDSFIVQVSDGNGGTATNTVTVTISAVNDAPVITEGSTKAVTMSEDSSPTAFSLTLNATDVESDTLTWSISTAAGHGTASASGTGASKAITYTPTANYNGTDSFVVLVSDGTLTVTITVNVTISAVNDFPAITEGSLSLTSTALDITRSWGSVATSSDGTKLVAGVLNGGNIYTSADSGATWTPRYSFSDSWTAMASSSDGTKLVAAGYPEKLYTSMDSGITWTARESSRFWNGVASSSDGTKLVAVANNAQIYTSTDSGVTWTARETSRQWKHVASSSDGTKLVAVAYSAQIYTSTDSGVTWSARETSQNWRAVASSSDGTKMVAAVSNGLIYTSTDSGVTWTARESSRNWTALASSSDGTKLAAVAFSGQVYTSSDSGVTWTAGESSRLWQDVAISSDGSKIFGVAYSGQIYLMSTAKSTSITMSEDGSPTAFALTLNATDADTTDTLTWSISTVASHGTASVSTSPTGTSQVIVFSPTANYNGTDSFVVQVSDGSATDTIKVNVSMSAVNDVPVVTQGATSAVTMSEDSSPTAFSLTINATDVDTSDSLTWSISTAAGHGTASASGTGVSKAITYTPTANYNGADSFVVQVSDGNGGNYTNAVTVTINSVNDVPVITEGATSTVTMSEDSSPTAFGLTLNATDIDTSDILTWSISTAASHGTASVSGTGASKAITYTPTANYNGTDSFVVQVSDGNGGTTTNTVSVTMTPVNDAPVVIQPSTQTLDVGSSLALSIAASDVDGDNLSVKFLDASRSWLSLSGFTLKGVIPAYEAGQILNLRMGISDGKITSEFYVKIIVNALPTTGTPSVPVTAIGSTELTVLGTGNMPLSEAKVQIYGQQLRYTDAQGKISFSVAKDLSSELKISAKGYEPKTITIKGSEATASITLSPATLILSGLVTLSDSASPLGAVVAASANLSGLIKNFETSVAGDGSYSLSLPQGSGNWSFGASFAGYASNIVILATNVEDTTINKNFTLVAETQFSWKAYQANYGDNISVWVTSHPSFAAVDINSVLTSVSEGNVSVASYDATGKAITFQVIPNSNSKTIQLSFKATPTSGQVTTLKVDLAVAQPGDAKKNLQFFERFSFVAGTQGQVSLSGLDSSNDDLTAIEVPAFGVSANVKAIRMERVQESITTGTIGSPVYSIDAYQIDSITGSLIKVGNSEISEIYLTFNYNPTTWNPATNFVSYSEDGGSSWSVISRSDIVAVDPVRFTVTLRSNHLSMWTLSGYDGLYGHDGGSTSGGGCVLK